MPCDNNTAPCGPDLTCIGNTAGRMGTCMAGGLAGATCGGTSGAGCDGTQGLACAGPAGAKTCTAIHYAPNGMPCGTLGDGSFGGCAGGGICYTTAGVAQSGEMGTCKAPAADGQACDVVLGPPCLTPARCVVSGGNAGVCTVPAGATCG